MIATRFYNGQGLGNQLWAYVVTRTIALDLGYDYGIMSPEKFKGSDFLELDYGNGQKDKFFTEFKFPPELPNAIKHHFIERDVWYEKFHCDIRGFDERLSTIRDSTLLSGYFQSEKYISHRRDEIKKWLQVNSRYDCREFSHENICVLNIRGGEYKGNPELILPKKYWVDAIKNMLSVNSLLEFVIITDDAPYAKEMFPDLRVEHFSIGKDYSIVKNAKYLILANSSFSFFPAWTSDDVTLVIAPKYWARHNISDGFWACEFNLYKDWLWQDRDGGLFTHNECEMEYFDYKRTNHLGRLGGSPKGKQKSIAQLYMEHLKTKMSKLKHSLLD
jgi:hypothetical protein